MDDAWEWATANRGQSDGFIAQSSQEYHPNPSHPRIQITGNINHGGAISCGAATTGLGNGGPDGTQGANAVWHAMHDALGLFPHP
jgi:hypothetical protein